MASKTLLSHCPPTGTHIHVSKRISQAYGLALHQAPHAPHPQPHPHPHQHPRPHPRPYRTVRFMYTVWPSRQSCSGPRPWPWPVLHLAICAGYDWPHRSCCCLRTSVHSGRWRARAPVAAALCLLRRPCPLRTRRALGRGRLLGAPRHRLLGFVLNEPDQ